MEKYFSVTWGNKDTGKVLVLRQGLYYRFQCRCALDGDGIYRLMLRCGTHIENLGVLIPQDGSFLLDTKIPVKRVGEGDMSFSLVSQRDPAPESFVPICPEEPFAYISRLKQSFLQLHDGQAGACLNKMQEC